MTYLVIMVNIGVFCNTRMPTFLGINLYNFLRTISVKILNDEFISLERRSVEKLTSVGERGGGKNETECE
jgi:hypothetical protein